MDLSNINKAPSLKSMLGKKYFLIECRSSESGKVTIKTYKSDNEDDNYELYQEFNLFDLDLDKVTAHTFNRQIEVSFDDLAKELRENLFVEFNGKHAYFVRDLFLKKYGQYKNLIVE